MLTNGLYISITNYLDDFLFLAMLRSLCNRLMKNFMLICEEVGCPIAIEKTEWVSEQIIFLGMMLNGCYLTISIPVEKLVKAQNILMLISEKKKVQIQEIQQLTGILNFFHRANVPGRPFTRRMYDNINLRNNKGQVLKNHHHVTLTKGFLKDCAIWHWFLDIAAQDGILLCRPFLDTEAFLHAAKLQFASDASLSRKLGMGAVFRNRWIVSKWGEKFIDKEKLSIEFLELYALVAGIMMWSKFLSNCRIIVQCDNQAVIQMVNKLTTKCPQCMKLIRLLTLDNIMANRCVFVEYVSSKQNILPDALSRLQFQHFWKHAADNMRDFPDTIHKDIWPVQKIWFNDAL